MSHVCAEAAPGNPGGPRFLKRGGGTPGRRENQFWDILREIAEGEGLSTNQLITNLYE
ncbi:ribbon-helix-helix domain-containing protein, partial [Pseudomonas aeruginosa]|nr:ribbon-helix-helix domain-containing protein [Pseudomonas aeruginosa]